MTDEPSRILIVDDDRITIRTIAAALREDYKVMAATSGAQALNAVHSDTVPDLILLDVMMPDIDGFETCKRLKADPETRDIPVMFLTARDLDRDETLGFELGAVDYINKPVVPSIVRARVKTQIELQRHIRELERAYTTIEVQRDRMEGELEVARTLQQSLLPVFPDTSDREVSLHASMSPAREMSGDFYDAFYIDDAHLCVCIGDVAGKGVPAALFMGISKALVRAGADDQLSTAAVVTGVNAEILKSNDACMFVTLFVGILEIKTGRLVYTNAGHNPPFLKYANGSVTRMATRHGPPVGAQETEYGESTLWLSKDETLLLYTDGVTEAKDEHDRLFGDRRLEDLVERTCTGSPKEMVETVMDAVRTFTGDAPRADDLTLMSLRFNVDARPEDFTRFESYLSEYDLRSRSIGELIARVLDPVELDRPGRETLELVMDETISNIINHGLHEDRPGEIRITLDQGLDYLRLHLVDNGRPFNPATAATPDTSLTLEERSVGGLGIHLCRSLMDDMSYERKYLRNHLTLTKYLNPQAPDRAATMQKPAAD